MSTFTANPMTLGAGYDNTSDFPTEAAGWGQPGQVRHAEAIGHGVWVAEHPEPSADELDALSTDEFSARTVAVTADIESAVAASKASRLFEEPEPTRCPIHDCIRLDHAIFELCEDAVGHTWFQGDPTEGAGA